MLPCSVACGWCPSYCHACFAVYSLNYVAGYAWRFCICYILVALRQLFWIWITDYFSFIILGLNFTKTKLNITVYQTQSGSLCYKLQLLIHHRLFDYFHWLTTTWVINISFNLLQNYNLFGMVIIWIWNNGDFSNNKSIQQWHQFVEFWGIETLDSFNIGWSISSLFGIESQKWRTIMQTNWEEMWHLPSQLIFAGSNR